MDGSIFESFMHPKMFKTNSTTLQIPSKIAKSQTKTTTGDKSLNKTNHAKLKHKFNVYE